MSLNGRIGCMPPSYGGPPLATATSNLNQWNRLDPSEILVHDVKCQDQIDDLLEDQMRNIFKEKFVKKAKKALKMKKEKDSSSSVTISTEDLNNQIKEFVQTQSIAQL